MENKTQRTREEIEKEYQDEILYPGGNRNFKAIPLEMELLLDIRDLLKEKE
jgi:hypothetical protein